jgi:hypothetical protein
LRTGGSNDPLDLRSEESLIKDRCTEEDSVSDDPLDTLTSNVARSFCCTLKTGGLTETEYGKFCSFCVVVVVVPATLTDDTGEEVINANMKIEEIIIIAICFLIKGLNT